MIDRNVVSKQESEKADFINRTLDYGMTQGFSDVLYHYLCFSQVNTFDSSTPLHSHLHGLHSHLFADLSLGCSLPVLVFH